MNEILPAIIAKDINELKDRLSQVEGLVSFVHLDIMDGVFVPPETWQKVSELKDLSTDLNMEAHLMVADVEDKIDQWLDSKISRIVLHFESLDKMRVHYILDKIRSSGKEVGFSLKMETDISEIEDFIDFIDVVQLMSIDKIGYYGESFDARVISKIEFLHQKYPNVKISVDGGVNYESAKILLKNNVDRLVVGSAIFKSENIKNSIKTFQNL